MQLGECICGSTSKKLQQKVFQQFLLVSDVLKNILEVYKNWKMQNA